MGEEKRIDPRYSLITEVDYVGEGMAQHGRISDLSHGGIFIDTINPLDIGIAVNFKFVLPGDVRGKPISGWGIVAWNQPMLGMGVRFTDLSQEDRDRIKAFLAER